MDYAWFLFKFDSRINWYQHSELEFVRRGAGPSPGEHVKRGHD